MANFELLRYGFDIALGDYLRHHTYGLFEVGFPTGSSGRSSETYMASELLYRFEHRLDETIRVMAARDPNNVVFWLPDTDREPMTEEIEINKAWYRTHIRIEHKAQRIRADRD